MKFGPEAQQKKLVTGYNTSIIVLSRFSSSRLPGKALMKIKDKPVLGYIIEKLEQVVPKNQIIIATSTDESDNAIAEFAFNMSVTCYRGSLTNVADRFYQAARILDCEYACRINGDNIFLDKGILIGLLKKANTCQFNFLSNVKGRTFPKGMSVEIVKLNHFKKFLPLIINDAYYSEHVMVHLYESGDTNKHYYLKNEWFPGAEGLQLALDTPEDFKRSCWIIEHLEVPHYQARMIEILNLTSNYERSIKG